MTVPSLGSTHIADVAGSPVRFFTDDVFQPPLTAFADLHRALGLPADDLKRCLECFELAADSEMTCSVRVDSGDDAEILLMQQAPLLSYVAGGVSSGLIAHAKAAAGVDAIAEATKAWLFSLKPSGEAQATGLQS